MVACQTWGTFPDRKKEPALQVGFPDFAGSRHSTHLAPVTAPSKIIAKKLTVCHDEIIMYGAFLTLEMDYTFH